MACGLFGRIASKPDPIAIQAPPGFFAVFEPWLQGAVAASRQELGEGWRAAFLAAPIWRFWLGGEICGQTILGALAPSIDSGGRYFPLCVFAAPEPGLAIPPPEFDAHEGWFAQAEPLLLSTLAPGTAYDDTLAALARLSPPAAFEPQSAAPPALALPGGVGAPLDDKPPQQLFSYLRRADWARAYGARSFWWTQGGAGFRPLALAFRLTPDVALFSALLTGDFAARGAGLR